MNENIYIISRKFFSLTNEEIMDDIDLFFIDYIESIGGRNNFSEHHSLRSRELYMCGWIDYKYKGIDFKDN